MRPRRTVEVNTAAFDKHKLFSHRMTFTMVMIDIVGLISDDDQHVVLPVDDDDAIIGLVGILKDGSLYDRGKVWAEHQSESLLAAAGIGYWIGKGMLSVVDDDPSEEGKRTVPLKIRIDPYITENLARLSDGEDSSDSIG